MSDKQQIAETLERVAEGLACFWGQDLWWILTALRGPDVAEPWPYDLKNATTARIRDAVGLTELKAGLGFTTKQWDAPLSADEITAVRQALIDKPRHFLEHAHLAMSAIERHLGKRIPTLDLLGG